MIFSSARVYAPFFVAVCLLAGAGSAGASTLTGSEVTGTIKSDNADISVATQFTSPAVIGPGTEFTGRIYDNEFSQTFDIAANFSAAGLEVSFTSATPGSDLGAFGSLFTLNFSDVAFTGSFALTGYRCNNNQNNYCNLNAPPSGLSADASGNMSLALSYAAIDAGQVYDFSYVPAAATPEPASIALLGTGLLGMVGAARRHWAA